MASKLIGPNLSQAQVSNLFNMYNSQQYMLASPGALNVLLYTSAKLLNKVLLDRSIVKKRLDSLRDQVGGMTHSGGALANARGANTHGPVRDPLYTPMRKVVKKINKKVDVTKPDDQLGGMVQMMTPAVMRQLIAMPGK